MVRSEANLLGDESQKTGARPVLEIFINHDCWVARYPEGARSSEAEGKTIRELFDGDEVPLPYTPEASAALVCRELARRNPDYEVRVVEGTKST